MQGTPQAALPAPTANLIVNITPDGGLVIVVQISPQTAIQQIILPEQVAQVMAQAPKEAFDTWVSARLAQKKNQLVMAGSMRDVAKMVND